MIPLGLSAVDQAAFERGLLISHEVDVQVSILDLDHRLVGSASGRVLSGQVDIDTTQTVDRSCRVQVLDPDNTLGLDTGEPSSVALYADRMVQIVYRVRSSKLPRWVGVPVFTGFITGLERTGELVDITGHGKEARLSGPCSLVYNLPKGIKKTTIIKALLAAGGETQMAIPDLPALATVPTSVAPVDALWERAQGWVRSLGMRLIYDGRGVARLVPLNPPVAWRFAANKDGQLGSLVSQPRLASDTTHIRNLVVVTGKDGLQAQASAPAAHPLSAQRLKRGGKPWHSREDVQDSGIESVKVAREVAEAKLSELLQGSMDVQFSALPIPHLEPWDRITVAPMGWSWPTSIQKLTLPLDGSAMTVGRHTLTRRIAR